MVRESVHAVQVQLWRHCTPLKPAFGVCLSWMSQHHSAEQEVSERQGRTAVARVRRNLLNRLAGGVDFRFVFRVANILNQFHVCLRFDDDDENTVVK